MDRLLIDYLPPILKDVREIKAITAAEQPEIEKLWESLDDIFAGQYIYTATGTYLKRWEKLVDITAKATDTVDERRAAVLMKWNQKPPFTLLYVKELIELIVGNDYYINIDHAKYLFSVIIKNHTDAVLRNVLANLKLIIPANLILVFAGSFESSVTIDIKYDTALILRSSFYPRYNVPDLFNDGYALMNGTYYMNGLQSDQLKDFYPMSLMLQSEINARPCINNELIILSNIEPKKTKYNTSVKLNSFINVESGYDNMINIRGSTNHEINSNSRAALTGTVEQNIAHENCLSVYSGITTKAMQQNQLRVQSSVSINVSSGESHLTVEKALGYNDGEYYMDGSRCMDAEIIEYEL